MELNNYLVGAIALLLLVASSLSVNVDNKLEAGNTPSSDEVKTSKTFSIIGIVVGVGLLLYTIWKFLPQGRRSSLLAKFGYA